jgi:capsular exopolysaccharide synthesis family protein
MSRKPVESEARTVVHALRRRLPLIVACALVAGGSALVLSLLQTKQYSAESSLLFRDPGFDQNLFGSSSVQAVDPAREAATNVKLVSLDAIADLTAKDLPGPMSGNAISDEVAVDSDGLSDVVTITATDDDPEFAARLANSFALNYIRFRRNADQAQVRNALRLIKADFKQLGAEERSSQAGRSLQREISRLKALKALQTGNAELVQKASVPGSPSSPKPLRNTLIGGFLGFLFGCGLALLFERLDRRLRSPKDFEDAFGLAVLTTIPDRKTLARDAREMPNLLDSDAEAFRMLRTRLRYFNVDRDIRSVLVTSSAPGDGKTTIAWNLAANAAEAGVRSILVEADFHRPSIAERTGLAPIPGLSEFLSGQARLEGVIQHATVGDRTNGHRSDRSVDVVVAGSYPPNPAELLDSDGMARLVDELTKGYELLVVDTPPISVLADAIPLLRHVSGVIVVGQLNRTTRDDATELQQQLQNLGAPTLGVVANRAAPRAGYGYGYEGYYGTQGSSADRPDVGRKDGAN